MQVQTPNQTPTSSTQPNEQTSATSITAEHQTASAPSQHQTPTSSGASKKLAADQTPTSSGKPEHQTPTSSGKLSQETAIRAVMEGTLLERTRLAVGALTTLLKNPEETEMVFVLALAINRGRIGELLSQLVGTDSGNWLLENKPSINSTAVDFDHLRQLPKGTLGHEYVAFLDRNNLDADFFEEPPGLSPMLRFIIKRMRQSHDVWHTVTGYSTDPSGEVELQAFTYGQVEVPSAALIALTGSIRGLRTDVGLPLRALRAYRRGRKAKKLAPMIWENHWERPISDVRAELDCAA